MAFTQTCPECGLPFEPDRSPGGQCPRCLLGVAMETEILWTKGEAADGAGVPRPAPSPEDLAPLFPFLEIQELLGRGAMGMVYRARQRDLDRVVALKLLPRELAADPTFAERFRREARALARLDHENIVRAYDSGELAEYTYFLMEYVDGVNLRQRMNKSKIGLADACRIAHQMASALAYAHQQGIVHRDVKPENVLVELDGRVKIADFGLARLTLPGQPLVTLTGTHQALGTPHYMSPEQWEAPASVDHRSDLYSLGVVFYELLVGELPRGRFEVPSRRCDCDRRVDRLVMQLLERDPERRPQKAGEVVEALEKIRDSVPWEESVWSALGGSAQTLRREFGALNEWLHDRWENDWKDTLKDAPKGSFVKVVDLGSWFRGSSGDEKGEGSEPEPGPVAEERRGPRPPRLLRTNPSVPLSLGGAFAVGLAGTAVIDPLGWGSAEERLAMVGVCAAALLAMALVHLPLVPLWRRFYSDPVGLDEFSVRWSRASASISGLGLLWGGIGVLGRVVDRWQGELHLGVAAGLAIGGALSWLQWCLIDLRVSGKAIASEALLSRRMRGLDLLGLLVAGPALAAWLSGAVAHGEMGRHSPGAAAALFWGSAPLLATWCCYAATRVSGALAGAFVRRRGEGSSPEPATGAAASGSGSSSRA